MGVMRIALAYLVLVAVACLSLPWEAAPDLATAGADFRATEPNPLAGLLTICGVLVLLYITRRIRAQ